MKIKRQLVVEVIETIFTPVVAVLYFSVPPADVNVLATGRETAHYTERMVWDTER